MDDLRYYINKVPHPIVQEFIEGKQYSLDVLVNTDNEILYAIPRRRIELNVKSVIEPREDLVELAKKVCHALKFVGVINIQATIDEKESQPKLIEINPRVAYVTILSVAAGFNLPLDAVYLVIGKPVELNLPAPRAIYMSRYYKEIFLADQWNNA